MQCARKSITENGKLNDMNVKSLAKTALPKDEEPARGDILGLFQPKMTNKTLSPKIYSCLKEKTSSNRQTKALLEKH